MTTWRCTETVPGEDRGRERSYVAVSQGVPKNASYHERLGDGKERFHTEFQREQGSADSLILDFQPLGL